MKLVGITRHHPFRHRAAARAIATQSSHIRRRALWPSLAKNGASQPERSSPQSAMPRALLEITGFDSTILP